ncbi:MAG TPA: hypothetical protein VF615_27215 [Longimicrobiaceae bacterium]|jgi:hypothetical protein
MSMESRDKQRATPSAEALPEELLEEFAITELEDRLEFVMKCDNNCGCSSGPSRPPST